MVDDLFDLALVMMADLSGLEYIIEKPVLQNSINQDDTILNCNLLDLINASGELEVVLDWNEENPSVTNRDASKINFNIHNTKDKLAEIFDNSSNNFSKESHSKNRTFDRRPTPYSFDDTSCKSDISDD